MLSDKYACTYKHTLKCKQIYIRARICAHEKHDMVVHEVVNIDKLHDSMNIIYIYIYNIYILYII